MKTGDHKIIKHFTIMPYKVDNGQKTKWFSHYYALYRYDEKLLGGGWFRRFTALTEEHCEGFRDRY